MLSTPKAKAELFLASSLYDGLEDNNIIQVTTLLLNKEADPNVLIPSQGITPFHLVIGNDSETFAEEVTKLFLRHGGNPNVKSTDGLTPVHVAAAWGRLGVLELLLSNGGDPLLDDNDGRCPFHYAFDEAHYDAVAILGKYCGESFDEYPGPKYNLALEKILVTEGDVVAEYAVSEDTCAATTTWDVPAINTKNILDNNSNFLENLNQSFDPGKTVENNASNPGCDFSKNANLTVTTSAEESSVLSTNSVSFDQNRRWNKTYNADVSDLTVDNSSELSLGDKIGEFVVDCRGLSRKTAINSEESMYDDSRDSRVTDVQHVSHDVAHVKDEVTVPVKSVNQITESSKMTNNTNSIGRFSNVITGFLQQGDHCGCVKLKEIKTASDSIGSRLPRPRSRLLTRNSGTSNLVNSPDPELAGFTNSDACLNRPKSREINDSLESYELSDQYAWDITSDGLSIESDKLLVSGSIHDNSINHESFVSIEEEYKYEDVEEGVILLERRLLTTPVSIPLIKTENEVSLSGTGGGRIEDESLKSRLSSLPRSFIFMDSETLRRELTKLDRRPPGPITATTRHVYLRRLWRLQRCGPTPASPVTIAVPLKFSAEIERTLRSEDWISDLSQHEALELQVFGEFSNPDPTRRWREGINKSSFNYLLMDPRITKNLPRRGSDLSLTERWRIFLSAIFYIGKGKRSRPYSHLYAAYEEWKKGKRTTNDEKISCILGIWQSDCGVVCLHLFQNAIPVEAYTREAAMIDALGLDRLKNAKSGNYYGVAATWSNHQKRMLGVYLLYKAMHILMHEGERQLSPENIER